MRRLALALMLLAITAPPALARHDAENHREASRHAPKPQTGIASFYAKKLVGHKTASGQILTKRGLTAAHRTLPFGTKLVVTNKRNGRKVVVTVNDRGPHRRGRIIDLSPAAAAQLGMTRSGLAPVELRRVALAR